MRLLSFCLVLAVVVGWGCSSDDEGPMGPSGKAASDCSLADILSGKAGCADDPTLDEVPEGYVPPAADTTVTDTSGTVDAGADMTTSTPAPSQEERRYVRLRFQPEITEEEKLILEQAAHAWNKFIVAGPLDSLVVTAGTDVQFRIVGQLGYAHYETSSCFIEAV